MKKSLLVMLMTIMLLSMGIAEARVETNKGGNNILTDLFPFLFSTISPLPQEQISVGQNGGQLDVKLIAYPCGSFYTCDATVKINYPGSALADTFHVALQDNCDGYSCNENSPETYWLGENGEYRLRASYQCTYNGNVCTGDSDDIRFFVSGVGEPECSTEGQTRCVDGTEIRQLCIDGRWEVQDNCALYNEECVIEGGIAHCVDVENRESCSVENSWQCDGDVRQRCLDGFWYDWYDCTPTGRECKIEDNLAVCDYTETPKETGDRCFSNYECETNYCNAGTCELAPVGPSGGPGTNGNPSCISSGEEFTYINSVTDLTLFDEIIFQGESRPSTYCCSGSSKKISTQPSVKLRTSTIPLVYDAYPGQFYNAVNLPHYELKLTGPDLEVSASTYQCVESSSIFSAFGGGDFCSLFDWAPEFGDFEKCQTGPLIALIILFLFFGLLGGRR